MRLLVTGTRETDPDIASIVVQVLEQMWTRHGTALVLVLGDCPTGVDHYAAEWASSMSVPSETYIARWDEHGRAAGPRRNQKMVDEGKPDRAIAFPWGESRGTRDCIRRCQDAGVPVAVFEVLEDED